MFGIPIEVLLVIAAALVFDFTNGWNDSANAIATVISTRVLPPAAALALSAVMNFAGAYLSVEVAQTIGKIVDADMVSQAAVMAGMCAAAAWVACCTRLGLPISASHSLVGGVVGAGLASGGLAVIHGGTVKKILIALVASPTIGFVLASVLMWLIYALVGRWTPRRVNRVFGVLQLVSVTFMGVSHGSNDAQKVMGVITLALVGAGLHPSTDTVPFWVITACAAAMAAGTALGGWRVIKMLGMDLIKLQPVHGFAAETAASATMLTAAAFGLPVSTTHTITGCILGVGFTKGIRATRWGLANKIVLAWVFTLPACVFLGIALTWVAEAILGK